MAKFEIVDKTHNIAFVTLERHNKLTLSEIETQGYIRWGAQNDYPKFLLELLQQDAEHGAIVASKASYLWGKGLKAVNEEQSDLLKSFLSQANPTESWDELGEKIAFDAEFIDGFFLSVITDLVGKPLHYYALQIANCRLNLQGDVLFHSNDWDRLYQNPITQYRIYEPGCKGSFFIPFKYHKPAKNRVSTLYPDPSYKSCIIDICADTEIGNFNYNFIANGFSGGTIVTFYNGEKKKKKKRIIKEKIVEKLTGTDNAGSTIINYVDKDGKPAEVTAVQVADLDKKFVVSAERALQKKITGHRITDPELFGIKKNGTGFSTKMEKRDSFDLFLNNYTKPRQIKLAKFIERLCYLKTGQWIEIEFIQNDPIGMDLLNDIDLTQDERRELKGYKPLIAPKVDANGQPLPNAEVAMGNDVLNTLSRKQTTNLIKTVDDYKKGRTTKAQAMILLKGFGMSEAEATEFLGDISAPVQMSAHERTDKVLMALEASAQDEDPNDEILFEEEVNFKDSKEALKFELEKQKQYHADPLSISVTALKSGILQLLKGNPTQTPDMIAKALGIDVNRVNTGIEGLLKKNLVDSNGNGFDPSEKAYDKETNPLKISTVYTVYKYALKSDAPPLQGGSSRPFCSKLMKASAGGKEWAFEAIDKMNNDMSLNVWDFRGGYYNNPETGETEPFCRHIWKAVTKIKRS